MSIKSKIRAKTTDIIKKNVFLRKIIRKLLFIKRKLCYDFLKYTTKVDDKLIIFTAFNGKAYTCSPRAIYEQIIKDDKYKDYKFVWAFKNVEEHKYLENNKNTKVILYGKKEYEKYLAKAKYWITNYRIFDHIYPKKNQVYLQCWHGTPLKRLGYDLEVSENVMNSIKEIRYKYRTDAKRFKYILSPSKFATEKFTTAWNLKELNKENAVIEEGYPRNDSLFNFTDETVANIKHSLNIENIGNKKIILYAPTWRDNQHTSGVGYTYKTEVDFDYLKKELENDYIILFRAHYLVANSFDFEKYKGFVYDVSNYENINDLYIISDILITDYSSVFFDYANLKKPMIFYMYDLEQYRDNLRGFYIGLDVLPGKIVEKENDLVKEIKNVTQNFVYDEKYKKFNDEFNYLDDGQAAKRVLEKIINN